MIHVFISDGRLLVRLADGTIREIDSHFVKEKIDSAEYHKSHSGWKGGASGDNPYWGGSIVWGSQSASGAATSFRFSDVIAVDDRTIYYTLTNNLITGLFKYDIADDEELRLFHRNGFVAEGMDFSTQRGGFVMAVADEDGRVCLQLLDERGSFKEQITAGDSCDCNPVFIKTDADTVLFQSTGIARNDTGYPMAFAPTSIKRLDLEEGRLTDLLGDDRFDYLLPRDDAQGNIYCIRRPYKAFGYVSPLRLIGDVVMFPIRFLVAIVNFLNAFTELFNRKPLRPGGPNVQPQTENKYVRVLGQMIDLAKIQKHGRSSDNASLVPGSWELVKLSPDGGIEVLAGNVAAYDIDNHGCIHFTNGYKVRRFIDLKPAVSFKYNVIETMKVATEPQ